MRTKTLLLTAALSAAGLATSLAQSNVYSLNIVGYVNVITPQGYSLISNPLKGTNDVISTVLPNTLVDTVVYKFTGGVFGGGNTHFGGNFWGTAAQTLSPGEGFLIYSPANHTNTFVGEVIQGPTTNALIDGFNMVGSKVSIAGPIDTLGLAAHLDDFAFLFTNGQGPGTGYGAATTYFGAPPGGFGWLPSTPNLNVAQAMMYFSKGANNWVQNYNFQ